MRPLHFDVSRQLPSDPIAAFVGTLNLHKHLDPYARASKDLELALIQLETFREMIWGKGLEGFIRFYVPRHLENGPTMDNEHLDECVKIAADPFVQNGTSLLLRRSKENKAISLNELVENVFSPKAKEYGDYRGRVRDNTLYRMRDIGLWSFTEEKKISKRGKEYHAGFQIEAGPTLIAFSKYIYVPWSKHQAKFAAHLIKEMEM